MGGLGDRLQADFHDTSFNPAGDDGRARPTAITWTGFGSSIALLVAEGATLAIDWLMLRPDQGAASAGVKRERLVSGLPLALGDSLIAPPLAASSAVYLVSEEECRIYPYTEPHLPDLSGPKTWSAQDAGEQICAVAMSADGEVFLASTSDGDAESGLILRTADGDLLARLETVRVPAGEGVGFAVQRSEAPCRDSLNEGLTFYAWRDGKISRHRLAEGPGSTRTFELPHVSPSPRFWRARAQAGGSVPWHDWRCAASGVYPVDTLREGQPALQGLKLDCDPPDLVRYGLGRFHAVIGGHPDLTLLVDPVSLQLVDAHSGETRAVREEAFESQSVFMTASSGNVICLSPLGDEEVVFRGLTAKAGNLENGFKVRLRRAAQRVGGAPRLLRADLPPIETDEGVLVGFEEDAGSDARLRLWHMLGSSQADAAR